MFTHPSSARAQPMTVSRGMSLIEILVALVVFSMGALAVAGLQVKSLKARQASDARGQATALLADMNDRIRSNADAASAAAYVYESDDYDTQRATMGSSPPTLPNDCESNNCSPAQIAANDLVDWRLALERQLPGGAGQISVAVTNVTMGVTVTRGYRVSVAWYDKDLRASAPTDSDLVQSDTCAAAAAPTTVDALNAASLAQRTCCPAELGDPVPAGVRCLNTLVTP